MQCNAIARKLVYCTVLYCTVLHTGRHRSSLVWRSVNSYQRCTSLLPLSSLPPSLQHSIKKSCPDVPTLKEYFDFSYGAPYSIVHQKAVQNFVKSLVGYSLITYLLQVSNGLCDKSVCTVWNMRQKASTVFCLVVHLYYTALYPHCPACLCHAELCCR
jgi:hypothetical protein